MTDRCHSAPGNGSSTPPDGNKDAISRCNALSPSLPLSSPFPFVSRQTPGVQQYDRFFVWLYVRENTSNLVLLPYLVEFQRTFEAEWPPPAPEAPLELSLLAPYIVGPCGWRLVLHTARNLRLIVFGTTRETRDGKIERYPSEIQTRKRGEIISICARV